MAVLQGSLPAFTGLRSCNSSNCLVLVTDLPESRRRSLRDPKIGRKMDFRVCRAVVQQNVQGASAAHAKEMERLSAKEALLLAFKDSGGFEALVTGKTTEVQRIDVHERITGLERLNPTPRPTTSPYFEGRWNFEWFGSGSPGLFAARFIFERVPVTPANFNKMDVLIKDGYGKVSANLKFLNLIETKFLLTTRLSVEGPLRIKQEYVEGVLESPMVIEDSVPAQLRGALGQATNALQQLPVPIRDAVAGGLRVPLSNTFQRWFMISYLDEEILVNNRHLNWILKCLYLAMRSVNFSFVQFIPAGGVPLGDILCNSLQLKNA